MFVARTLPALSDPSKEVVDVAPSDSALASHFGDVSIVSLHGLADAALFERGDVFVQRPASSFASCEMVPHTRELLSELVIGMCEVNAREVDDEVQHCIEVR